MEAGIVFIDHFLGVIIVLLIELVIIIYLVFISLSGVTIIVKSEAGKGEELNSNQLKLRL